MDVPPPEAAFFEELLKHKPIRPVLIKQLSLLDALTLIRLAKTSSALAAFAKDDAIWLPKLQKDYGGVFNEEITYNNETVYETSIVYLCFPSFYDAYLYMVARNPHIWTDKFKYISAQDWDFKMVSTAPDSVWLKRALDGLGKRLYASSIMKITIITKNKGERSGEIRLGPEYRIITDTSVFKNYAEVICLKNYALNSIELVPRLSFWFKVSDDRSAISFIQTKYAPNPLPQFSGDFYFKIFESKELSQQFRFHNNQVEVWNEELPVSPFIFTYGFSSNVPSQRVSVEGEFSPNFSMCFFITLGYSIYAYRLTPEIETLRKKGLFGMMYEEKKTYLIIHGIESNVHRADPNRFEYAIDSCLTCGEPAKLKCSGCNRASFCSTECGQEAWSNKTHSTVCSILK